MAKPSVLPRWADTAAPTDVVAPNSSKQGSGWSNGELPPHTYFNWWQNLVYQWIQWLNGLLDTANTWSARQTFSGGATVVDPPVNATDAASKNYVDAEATSRANADALLMPKAGGTFTGPVAAPSLNAPAGGALAIGATDDHATTLNRNGTVALSLDSDAQGADLFGLALGASTHIRNVRSPQFGDWAANRDYVDTSVAGLTFPPSLQTINPTNSGEFLGTITYWKDACGIVHLEGWASHVAGSSVYVVQLPVGFRPANDAHFAVNVGNVTVTTDGWVSVSALGILTWFLTPVAFRAA